MLKSHKKSSQLRTLSLFLRTFALVKKKTYTLLVFVTMAAAAGAQTTVTNTDETTSQTAERLTPSSAASADSIARPKLTHELLEEARRDEEAARIIDLPLGRSALADADRSWPYGWGPYGTVYSPWSLGGLTSWRLHEGFNAEVGFSVSGSFGKNRIKGAGFGEHLAAAYAMPFGKDKRWIGALGIYADRLDWGSYHRTEAGIAGLLGYNVNDRINLYVYGAYNFVPGQEPSTGSGQVCPNPYALTRPFSPYGYGICGPGYGLYGPGYGYGCGYGCAYPFDPYANLRGRIGAAAEFKVGEAATITVAFEHDFYDNSSRRMPIAPPPAPEKNKPYGIGDSPNSASGGGNWRR